MRVLVGPLVGSLMLFGCAAERGGGTSSEEAWEFVAAGRTDRALEVARDDLASADGEFEAATARGNLIEAYRRMAEERIESGDSAAAEDAVVQILRLGREAETGGEQLNLLAALTAARTLQVRMGDLSAADALALRIDRLLEAEPWLYDSFFLDAQAETALAYLEIGQPDRAARMARATLQGYQDVRARKVAEHRTSLVEYGGVTEMIPRYWPGLKALGRILLETGDVDRGVSLWFDNFTVNRYLHVENFRPDAEAAATAFEGAGRGDAAARLRTFAAPLAGALARRPYASEPVEDMSEWDDWYRATTESSIAWHRQILAAQPADSPLRAPYQTWLRYERAVLADIERDERQREAERQAEIAGATDNALSALGSALQVVTGAGAVAYGTATGNSALADLGQQQLEAMADAGPSQPSASAAASYGKAGSGTAAADGVCGRAKGPRCRRAEDEVSALLTRWTARAPGSLTPESGQTYQLSSARMTGRYSYCSSMAAADAARACAAEFRSRGAPADCARLADETAESYEGAAAQALAHIAAQTAGPAVTAADMDCASLP